MFEVVRIDDWYPRHSLLMVPLRCGLLFLRCISVEPIKQVILLNESYFTCEHVFGTPRKILN